MSMKVAVLQLYSKYTTAGVQLTDVYSISCQNRVLKTWADRQIGYAVWCR